MVVNADERTTEGQYFAEGDKYGVVYLAQWWAEEARGEHYAAEAAQCHSDDKLQTFHTNVYWYFLLALRAETIVRAVRRDKKSQLSKPIINGVWVIKNNINNISAGEQHTPAAGRYIPRSAQCVVLRATSCWILLFMLLLPYLRFLVIRR